MIDPDTATKVDPARLLTFLNDVFEERETELGIAPVSGGLSNLLFRVDHGARRLALRRPPMTPVDASSNDISREIRLLKALGRTSVPHARLLASEETGSVIGAPFALLEWVDGFAPRSPLPPAFRDDDAKTRMGEEIVDALAMLHAVDWRAIGLSDFGRPDNFLERQVDRWEKQLARSGGRKLDGFVRLARLLRDEMPKSRQISLIHGDYQFVNVMFAPATPPRLSAIVDWELATIGDPMLDLGWLLASWRDEGEPESFAPYLDWNGFPPRADMAARYAQASGLDVGALPYYMALASFKLAVILEGWYQRYLAGQSTLERHASMEYGVPRMLERALQLARWSGGPLLSEQSI
ncbi:MULTISPECIES: phosphotransferase family protein [Sphingobium]|uniref:phosphotransferase family protein n=1 Tax=Sphingobium TaxID=165695 RepID=UPI00159C19CD|nr:MULTISPECIES: phosphotransferase family protein [unclassified Sphingobium]